MKKVIEAQNFLDSQLAFADRELERRFWRAIMEAGVPFLFLIAIWTNVVEIPVPVNMPILSNILDVFVAGMAVFSGIATFLMPAYCLKAQNEVRREIQRRKACTS